MKLYTCLSLMLLGTSTLFGADKGGSGKDPAIRDIEAKISSHEQSSSDSEDDSISQSDISSIVGVSGDLVVGKGGYSSVIVSSLSFDSHDMFTLGKGGIISVRKSPVLMGSGKSAVKKWSISDSRRLTRIRANGSGSLDIISGDSNQITVQADDNLIEHLSVSLTGEELTLEQEAKMNVSYKTPVVYTVQLRPAVLAALSSIATELATRIKTPLTVKNLSLSTSGTNSFSVEEGLKVEKQLNLESSGTGKMMLGNIVAQQLMINHSGTGSLAIAGGKATTGMFTISGTGSIRAAALLVNMLILNQSGTGSLKCNVQESVSGSLSGTGSFSNYGKGDARNLRVTGFARYKQKQRSLLP